MVLVNNIVDERNLTSRKNAVIYQKTEKHISKLVKKKNTIVFFTFFYSLIDEKKAWISPRFSIRYSINYFLKPKSIKELTKLPISSFKSSLKKSVIGAVVSSANLKYGTQ
jgi:hypothetical protein